MFKLVKGERIREAVRRIKSGDLFTSSAGEAVSGIVERVRKEGDKALIEFTEKFDNVKLSREGLAVTKKEIDEAYGKVDSGFIETLERLGTNITKFHEKQRESEWFDQGPGDILLGMRNIPLDSAGIYVPGGRARYPSSVMMSAIPAKVAGVKRIVMATPPPVDPYVLVTAEELKIGEIYKVGGAQAIAALAYGTETIKRVDKIVGPGNMYVTLAKKLVSGVSGIDSLAGPSDILIIADKDSEPGYIAADMLSQCEHDPDARALLVTDSEKTALDVNREAEKQFRKLKRQEIIKSSVEKNCMIFVVENIREAVDICNEIAPEHLEILLSPPQAILEHIRHAGAVFLGPYSPVALGDYGAGPNHVLPTYGTARFSSPLGVYDFIKRQSILGYTKAALSDIRKDVSRMAEVEGFDAHKRAIDIRFS